MAKAKLSEKDARNQEIDDLKSVLATESGKRFAWRLLEVCGVYQLDAELGSRRVGLWFIDEMIEANPKAAAELIINNKVLEKDDENDGHDNK